MRSSKISGDHLIAYGRMGKDGRVTIPASVGQRLRLRAGDELVFAEAEDGVVLVSKRPRLDMAFLHRLEATLSEWNSPENEEAFRYL